MRGDIGSIEFMEQFRVLRKDRIWKRHRVLGIIRRWPLRRLLKQIVQRHIQTERLSRNCRKYLVSSRHESGLLSRFG
jgi:hypothetical protein